MKRSVRLWFEDALAKTGLALKNLEPPQFIVPTPFNESWGLADRTMATRVMVAVQDMVVIHPKHCDVCQGEFTSEINHIEMMISRYLQGSYTEPSVTTSVSYGRRDGSRGFSMTYVMCEGGFEPVGFRPSTNLLKRSSRNKKGVWLFEDYDIVNTAERVLFKEELVDLSSGHGF